MAGILSKAAAIVGAAEANEIGFLENPVSSLQLHIEAIKNLSDQTGVPISKIEGVFSTGWSSELCEHLGITPKYIDTTAVGGCSFEMHVHHALAAIIGPGLIAKEPTGIPGILCIPNTDSTGYLSNKPSSIIAFPPPSFSSAG